MSKHFPDTARKWDMYIGAPGPLLLNQVVFVDSARLVIKEEYTREAWDAERAIPPSKIGAFSKGMAELSTTKPEGSRPDGSSEIPEDMKFFYGAEWLR